VDEKKKEDQKASTTLNEEDQLDIEAAIEAKMRERNPLLTKTKAELRYIQTTTRMVGGPHFAFYIFNIISSLKILKPTNTNNF